MPLKIKTKQIIACRDWDKLVKEVYGRPYCLQQQDGCKPRGLVHFTVPNKDEEYDEDANDTIPATLRSTDDGKDMGVKFATWLARDPEALLDDANEKWMRDLWWARQFFPDFQTVANDLHAKGYIPAGSYTIEIDW